MSEDPTVSLMNRYDWVITAILPPLHTSVHTQTQSSCTLAWTTQSLKGAQALQESAEAGGRGQREREKLQRKTKETEERDLNVITGYYWSFSVGAVYGAQGCVLDRDKTCTSSQKPQA